MVIDNLFLELILFESYTNITFLLINTIHIELLLFEKLNKYNLNGLINEVNNLKNQSSKYVTFMN
jgi:hypothetical protein